LLLGVFVAPVRPTYAQAAPQPPNILLIISDDQPTEMFTPTFMPAVFSQISNQGVRFDRAYDNPRCAVPRDPRSSLAVGASQRRRRQLHRARSAHDRDGSARSGLADALTGKYLNSWNTCGPRPGFDEWACVASGKSSNTLVNPWINDNGSWSQVTGYQPALLADRMVQFLNTTPTDQPFFGIYAPTTPHLPANGNKYPAFQVPLARAPSYDEETRSADHPPVGAKLPPDRRR